MPTPCEDLEYKVGDAFYLLSDESSDLSAGDIIYLHKDDGSSCPEFRDQQESNEDDYREHFDLSKVIPFQSGITVSQCCGYKEGDLFVFVNGSDFEKGQIIRLQHDDDTACPYFESLDEEQNECLYLDQVIPLEPREGRTARIRRNRVCGFPEGTEAKIERIQGRTAVLYYRGSRMEHPLSDIVTFALADDEKVQEPKITWEVTSVDKWQKGDIAIVRVSADYHTFYQYSIVTFVNKNDNDEVGNFVDKDGTQQALKYKDVEKVSEPDHHVTVEFHWNGTNNAVACIKAIRRLTGWGLKEAKDSYEESKDNDGWVSLGVYKNSEGYQFYAQCEDADAEASLSNTYDSLTRSTEPATTWPTKSRDGWETGDKGIIRSRKQHDEFEFPIGATVTLVSASGITTTSRGEPRGRFTDGNKTQWIELHLLEPVDEETQSKILGEAARLIIGDEMATSQPRQIMYYQDGDSKEMTLIGYFQSKPVLGYIDRWNDPQVFIGKESLMTEIE